MSPVSGNGAFKEKKSAQNKTKMGNASSTGNGHVTTKVTQNKKVTLPPVNVPKGNGHASEKPKQKFNKEKTTNKVIDNISILVQTKSPVNTKSSSNTQKANKPITSSPAKFVSGDSFKIKHSVKPSDNSANKTYSNKPNNTDKSATNSNNLSAFVFNKVGSSLHKCENAGKLVLRSSINSSSTSVSKKKNPNKCNYVNKPAPNLNNSLKSTASGKGESANKLTTSAGVVNSSTAKKRRSRKRNNAKIILSQNVNCSLIVGASQITSDKNVNNNNEKPIPKPIPKPINPSKLALKKKKKKKNFNKSSNSASNLIGHVIVSSAPTTICEATAYTCENTMAQIFASSSPQKCDAAGPASQSSASTLQAKLQNVDTNESKKSVKPVSFSINALKKKAKSKCKSSCKLFAVNPKSTSKDQVTNEHENIDEKLVADKGPNEKSVPSTEKATPNHEMIRQWLNNFCESAVKFAKPEPTKDNPNFLTVHNNIFTNKEEEPARRKALFKTNKNATKKNKDLVKRNESEIKKYEDLIEKNVDAVKRNEKCVEKNVTPVAGNDKDSIKRNGNTVLDDLLGFIGSANDQNKNNNLHSNQETANSASTRLSSVIDSMSKTNISDSSDSAEDYYSTLKKKAIREIIIQSNVKMASLLFANDSLIKYQDLCLSVIEDVYKLSINHHDLDVYNKYKDQIKQEAAAETVNRAVQLALQDYKKKIIKLSSMDITKSESEHLHEEVCFNIISSFSAFWDGPVYKQQLRNALDTAYYELLSELCQIKFFKRIESAATVNDLPSVDVEAVLNDYFSPDSWLDQKNKVNKYRLSTILLQKLTDVAITLLKSDCEKILDEYINGGLMLLISSSFDETFESVKNNAISVMRKINAVAVDDVIREFHHIKTKYDRINEEKSKNCGAVKDGFKTDLT